MTIRRVALAVAAAAARAGCGGGGHAAMTTHAKATTVTPRSAAAPAPAGRAVAGARAASAPAAAGAPAHRPAAARPAAAAAAAAPAEALPALRSLLLTRQDLGDDWDDVHGREDSATQPHKYCGPAFASDGAATERVYTELARHTDGLRVQQEAISYSGGGAEAALADFAAALRCGHYASGTGADRLDIETDPTDWAPAAADGHVSGSVTFRQGTLVLHSRLAVYRRGDRVDLVSIAFEDASSLESAAPGIARAAVRAAGWA